MKRIAFLKGKTTTIRLMLSLGLLIGSFGFSASTAVAQTPYLFRTYQCSGNFSYLTLNINQSGATIWGDMGGDYISGFVSQDSLSGASTITFTRYGMGFTQTYTGKIEVGRCSTAGCPGVLLHGMFTHNGSGKYGWYASR